MVQIKRRKTKSVKIGSISIGGNNPIAIQSMVKTPTTDIEKTVRQINTLKSFGCEIVRLAVRDRREASLIRKIKPQISLPLVADIHFDWRLALMAIDNGADKIRLNPGNIYKKDQVREIAKAARLNHIPIRVGVNSGSLRRIRNVQQSTVHSVAKIMVEEALNYIKILESFGFSDIVVSLKGSDIWDTVEAYRRIARLCAYPLHLGVTATGTSYLGAIKSSIAVGVLLLEGIGDTIRISLTAAPFEEIEVAKSILKATRLRSFGPEIISCPTCGRCEVDLVGIVKKVEDSLADYPVNRLTSLTGKPIKVAIMGCVVNGPGEARGADIGIAFGKKDGLLFKEGRPVRKISSGACVSVLLEELRKRQG